MSAAKDLPSRTADLARFLGCWGRLAGLGVESRAVWQVLALEGPTSLRPLAQALEEGSPEQASQSLGDQVPSWLLPLLEAPAGDGRGLVLASQALRREAGEGWSAALIWARLRALSAGGARPGDALGALAHEAREHGRKGLAEALNSAARQARAGQDLAGALASAGGYTRAERLAVERLEAAGLEPVLEALEELAGLEEGTRADVAAVAPEEDTLARLADAASAGAAPLKRGLERVLTGIEGMLGIDRQEEKERAERLARDTLQRRAPPAAGDAEGAPAAEAAPPAPAASRGPRKTIGGDSGPVRKNELHDGSGGGRTAPEAREAWLAALEEAGARMTLLELQPDETGLAAELTPELTRLKAGARGLGLGADDLQALAALQTRLDAWRRKHGR